MGQELEEHSLMFELNEKYLNLRKLYETYKQINRSIDDWTRGKKAYSRYTLQGKKENWRIDSGHIRSLEEQRQKVDNEYTAICLKMRDDFLELYY